MLFFAVADNYDKRRQLFPLLVNGSLKMAEKKLFAAFAYAKPFNERFEFIKKRIKRKYQLTAFVKLAIIF
ncbi:MAG TPA: hypothetical protein VK766_04070 [Cytophagaceae bacterium]|jgi:hypothetical protein|nr:hypothetical protein [Cytophagaceae bacterium]